MKTVAFVPIKLNSTRLPNKNILELDGHPLCWHMINTLLQVDNIDEVYVYCSDERIREYIPEKAVFLKRDAYLDGDMVKGAEIYRSFIQAVPADIYVLAHVTSPFVKASTIEVAVAHVKDGAYDSAFSAKKIQNFVWYKEQPLNYNLEDVPRTQDLEPIWVETSAFFVFKKELFLTNGRRIGFSPFRQEVAGEETIDIDYRDDYELAKAYALARKL